MTRLAELNAGTQRRLDEAAGWHLRLRSNPSLELSPDYVTWIADGENVRALEAIEEGWSTVGDLGAAPEFLTLRRSALARAQRAGVKRWSPRRVAGLAAAFVLACVGGGGAIYEYLRALTTYETDIGERRVVALPDGSRISMDSDTEVKVRYSENARTLELDHGRARFDVAHDVARPFTVTAGDETVVAIGTSFNVERLGSTVLVTLTQGRVVVKQANGRRAETPALRKQSVSLQPGEQLVAKAAAAAVIAPANIQTANAWEAGHLIFRDEVLGDAVERVNRYTDRPIMVDPNIASIRISGVFHAGDIPSFVSAVTGYFPLQATMRSDSRILLQPRA